MASGGKSPEEARRLRELLEKAKQFAREHYRGPEAIDVNTEILNIDPNQIGSYTRRGTCYLAAGDLDAAEDDFNDALGLDPSNNIAFNPLREIDEMRASRKSPEVGDPVQNIFAKLQEILEGRGASVPSSRAAPSSVPAHGRQDAVAGREDPMRSLRLQRMSEYAEQLAWDGEYGPEALDMNSRIIKLDPSQASAYTRRGICYLASGDIDAAEKDFVRACELDPNDEIAADWLETLPDIEEARQTPLPLAWRSPDEFGSHSVYVIELDRAVLDIRKFRTHNPIRDPSKPCLYVGQTSRTPQERFENHKAGIRGSRYVRKHGIRLLPHLYEHLNPVHSGEAEMVEEDLADELRWKGYTVWSN